MTAYSFASVIKIVICEKLILITLLKIFKVLKVLVYRAGLNHGLFYRVLTKISFPQSLL